jgi:hypothetical protein
MIAGSDSLLTYSYSTILDGKVSPPHTRDDGITVDLTGGLKMTKPDITNSNINNPDPQPFFLDYGLNIVLMSYSKNDTNLAGYETMFKQVGFAIAPMSSVLKIYAVGKAQDALNSLNAKMASS